MGLDPQPGSLEEPRGARTSTWVARTGTDLLPEPQPGSGEGASGWAEPQPRAGSAGRTTTHLLPEPHQPQPGLAVGWPKSSPGSVDTSSVGRTGTHLLPEPQPGSGRGGERVGWASTEGGERRAHHDPLAPRASSTSTWIGKRRPAQASTRDPLAPRAATWVGRGGGPTSTRVGKRRADRDRLASRASTNSTWVERREPGRAGLNLGLLDKHP